MSHRMYYRITSKKKRRHSVHGPSGVSVQGHSVEIAELVSRDRSRDEFKKRVVSSSRFRDKIGWKDKSTEEYLREWKERAKVGGLYVPRPDHINARGVKDGIMIDKLFELGTVISENAKDETYRLLTKDGKEMEFSKEDVCVYDASQDDDDPPDDVISVSGFGEASMLKVFRRRYLEKLNIFTYVGDVVVSVNPYMYLPEMARIPSVPKKYEEGKDPSVFAVAHFAYWSIVEPHKYNLTGENKRNQSCPVSGESGAGKTVACGFIMKYLAQLSRWRSKSLGKSNERGDVTSLVAGVSPFIEGFGNAKTNMNDNSSRFGKFTKIFFKDGMIYGANMVKYLLEKSRIVDQGENERNYHIFYGLIKGATAEERKKYALKSVNHYEMLMHGHCAIIDHETKTDGTNTYDFERMNNPLSKDPDDTGYRAALQAAKFGPSRQIVLWDVLVAILKLGNMHFKPSKKGLDGTGSEIMDQALCKDVEKLLGVRDLDKNLVIYRRVIPGEGIIDTPVSPSTASDQTKALMKSMYDRVFAKLFADVINEALDPHGDAAPVSDGFIGLLDIFGFEVFKKNSFEQLCINFANEKLQLLFNDHIFNTEKLTYESQNVPQDCIPPKVHNKPCVDLIERSKGAFVGILPLLDDMRVKDSVEANRKMDTQFCDAVINRWGRERGKSSNSLKDKRSKDASKCFYAKKNSGSNWFCISHFAGDVKYFVENWVVKNHDRVPIQITELMSKSDVQFVRSLFAEKSKKCEKRHENKTIASRFLNNLSSLSNTLQKTTPHYVKCVKPNDIHFRPIDGVASFDSWKTYRQLKFAGIMEVCKIKLQGYPFRRDYVSFWNDRCVRNKYHIFAGLDKRIGAKDGCEALCKLIMPKPQRSVIDGVMRPTWVLGKTWLFGKDYLLNRFAEWHKTKVIDIVQHVTRYYIYRPRLRNAMFAASLIGSRWKRKLLERKAHAAARLVKKRWRSFHVWMKWADTCRRLERVDDVRDSSVRIQRSWRRWNAYRGFVDVLNAKIHMKAREVLGTIANRVRSSVATSIARRRIRDKFRRFRVLRLVQSRVRSCVAIRTFRQIVRDSAGERKAVRSTMSLFMMCQDRTRFVRRIRAAKQIQRWIRGRLLAFVSERVWWYWYDQNRNAIACSARNSRAIEMAHSVQYHQDNAICLKVTNAMCRAVKTDDIRSVTVKRRIIKLRYRHFVEAVTRIQRRARQIPLRKYLRLSIKGARVVQVWYRQLAMLKRFYEKKRAVRYIETQIFSKNIQWLVLRRWLSEVRRSVRIKDHFKLRNLFAVDRYPWTRLKGLRSERIGARGVVVNGLVNIRSPVFFTSFLHDAVDVGSLECVRHLIEEGADVEALCLSGKTPLHMSCAAGDLSLDISKLLVEALRGRVTWVLTRKDRDGHNVMDCALLSTEDASHTIEWLRHVGARASEEVMQQLREDTYEKEKQQEERMEQDEKVESNSKIMEFMLMRSTRRKSIEDTERYEKKKNEERKIESLCVVDTTAVDLRKQKPASPRRLTLGFVSKDAHHVRNVKALRTMQDGPSFRHRLKQKLKRAKIKYHRSNTSKKNRRSSNFGEELASIGRESSSSSSNSSSISSQQDKVDDVKKIKTKRTRYDLDLQKSLIGALATMQGTRQWYVYDDGVVKGAFPSSMLSDFYERGRLADNLEVRIGPTGTFVPLNQLTRGSDDGADINPFEPNGIDALKVARRHLSELVSI